MPNIITETASTFQAFFERFASAVVYKLHGGAEFAVKAFARGVSDDDLFAEAQQRDIVAVVDAAKFASITGQDTPRRLDRMIIRGSSYTVETWRGAPVSEPTFFKLLLRGGQQ